MPAGHAVPATSPPPSPTPPAAWAVLAGRSALFVRGTDAVRFLDNFTTAAVARLEPGRGTEGFFADARGRVLALVNILRTEDTLWIDAAPGIAAPLRTHLDHYLIRERVELDDLTDSRGTLVLLGPDGSAWLAEQVPFAVPAGPLAHGRLAIDGLEVAAVTLDWFGAGGLLLQCARNDLERLAAWLRDRSLPELDAAAVDAARIRAGSPDPADVDDRALPQEFGRDARAICFTKGCYLGQETVARLDALGHVNRRLAVLATGSPPQVGATVTAGGEPIGRVTSACTVPDGTGLGMGLLHVRGLDSDRLEVDGRPARIVHVPGGRVKED